MFELNCIYAGYKKLKTKNGKAFLLVTLCFPDLGAVKFFAPEALSSVLDDLDFGAKYNFIFSISVRDDRPSLFISGVDN